MGKTNLGWYCAAGPIVEPDELSDEELAIIGELDDVAADTDDDAGDLGDAGNTEGTDEGSEHPDGEDLDDDDEDPDGQPGDDPDQAKGNNLVPQERVDQIVKEREEYKRELERIRQQGQAPAGTPPAQSVEAEINQRILALPSEIIQSGPGPYEKYHGMTLEALWDENPSAAHIYQTNRINAIVGEYQEAATRERAQEEQQENWTLEFAQDYAKNNLDLDIKSLTELTPEQWAKIDAEIGELDQWMKTQGKDPRLYPPLDIAAIKARRSPKSRTSGKNKAKEIVGKVKGAAPSIDGKQSSSRPGGYDELLSLTQAEMIERINNMDDAETQRFLKNAPAKFKEKYSGIDWFD